MTALATALPDTGTSRLLAKVAAEKDLPPVVRTLWGLDDSGKHPGTPERYMGTVYEVSLTGLDGTTHSDWVAAESPVEALNILADNVEAWFRCKKRPCPNLIQARINNARAAEFNFEADELVRLGKARLQFADGLIDRILLRQGWQLPATLTFQLPKLGEKA